MFKIIDEIAQFNIIMFLKNKKIYVTLKKQDNLRFQALKVHHQLKSTQIQEHTTFIATLFQTN